MAGNIGTGSGRARGIEALPRGRGRRSPGALSSAVQLPARRRPPTRSDAHVAAACELSRRTTSTAIPVCRRVARRSARHAFSGSTAACTVLNRPDTLVREPWRSRAEDYLARPGRAPATRRDWGSWRRKVRPGLRQASETDERVAVARDRSAAPRPTRCAASARATIALRTLSAQALTSSKGLPTASRGCADREGVVWLDGDSRHQRGATVAAEQLRQKSCTDRRRRGQGQWTSAPLRARRWRPTLAPSSLIGRDARARSPRGHRGQRRARVQRAR
mgnify:CR=1 FL=1